MLEHSELFLAFCLLSEVLTLLMIRRFFFSKSDLAGPDDLHFVVSGDLSFATPRESTALGQHLYC